MSDSKAFSHQQRPFQGFPRQGATHPARTPENGLDARIAELRRAWCGPAYERLGPTIGSKLVAETGESGGCYQWAS